MNRQNDFDFILFVFYVTASKILFLCLLKFNVKPLCLKGALQLNLPCLDETTLKLIKCSRSGVGAAVPLLKAKLKMDVVWMLLARRRELQLGSDQSCMC